LLLIASILILLSGILAAQETNRFAIRSSGKRNASVDATGDRTGILGANVSMTMNSMIQVQGTIITAGAMNDYSIWLCHGVPEDSRRYLRSLRYSINYGDRTIHADLSPTILLQENKEKYYT
jgi:hypothetical protein